MFTPEISAVSVVLRGNFNPQIFHPTWFAGQGLLPQTEADGAEVRIIHPEVSSFSTDNLDFEVTLDRLVVGTNRAPFPLVRDLVSGSLKVLSHTPVHTMGINRDVHIKMVSESRWHELGNTLSPKEVWGELLKAPGMRSLVIESLRLDERDGRIFVKVEPSQRIHPGVFVEVNDHFDLADPEGHADATQAVETLIAGWDTSLSFADSVIEQVLSVGT